MGSFGAKVAKANPSGQGVYFSPDFTGICEITGLKYITTRSQDDAFIVDVNILTSNSAKDKAGGARNWFVPMDADGMGLGNAQKFFEALFGVGVDDMEGDTDEEKEAAFGTLIDEAMDPKTNPMVGRLIELKTATIKTKKKGTDFTLHTWTPVAEEQQTDEEYKAKLREHAGLAAF